MTLGMQIAYFGASPPVCVLRDDTFGPWMQSAYMDTEPKNYLKEWRLYRRLTQEELAELAATTKAVISHLETGTRGLSAKWLARLAPALGTRPGFLLDVNPLDGDTEILEAALSVPSEDRAQALRILETFKKTA